MKQHPHYGVQLKNLRTTAGVAQDRLAEALGMSGPNLCKIEKGSLPFSAGDFGRAFAILQELVAQRDRLWRDAAQQVDLTEAQA